jgi:toluene monooxygenase electron transfer component
LPLIQIDGVDEYECADDDTILRSALRAGLGFPYGCNTGSCGNCRFQLIDGAVDHLRADPPAWTDRDRKRGRWLGCQARPRQDCRIKVRLDSDAVPSHPPVSMRGRLTDVVQISHDISEFGFALDGPDDFVPGQYALIQLEGVNGTRSYSMCNLPGTGEWRFQIKRVPGGAATEILFGGLRPGDSVGIDGPYGLAYLREDRPGNLLLVAGGSGLSPMISIARAATANPALSDREINFFYGGRLPTDLCAEPLLSELPGFGARLTHVAAVSDPSDGWNGPTGFIHEVVKEHLGERLSEFEIYFAGPPPMAKAMQIMLHEAGVEPERMHFDEFF